jgi:molybdate transport system substrate-binding protein
VSEVPDAPRRLPRRGRALLALLGSLAFTSACGDARSSGEEVVVSAASSLADVVTEAAAAFEASESGVNVTLNFGSSGTLAQQILHGAGVDLFLPASEREMALLAGEGMIETLTRRVLASNELVLVVPVGAEGSVRGMADLATERVGSLAIGAPESVPAGEYAREMLAGMGIWARVERKAVRSSNVRHALTYVERGEVDAALVYRTDARGSRAVTVVAAAPPGSHTPILYPGAVVAGADNRTGALRFLRFLTSAPGEAIFREHGFAPPPDAEAP